MALWQQNLELAEAKVHLDKAALILEMVRRETSSLPKIVDGRMATNYKLTLFDIQTQCYQALQRVLVTLGKENEALVIAERARIRAFVDLLQVCIILWHIEYVDKNNSLKPSRRALRPDNM